MRSLTVFLYGEPYVANLDVAEILMFVSKWLPMAKVEIRPSFVAHCLEGVEQEQSDKKVIELSHGFARSKVRNLDQRLKEVESIYGEVEFERRRLTNPQRGIFGLLYDGFMLMNLFRRLISHKETRMDCLHIVFTNQLIGTYDEGSRRYHARVAVFGYPCIISTTGLIEAPARPPEFYVLKQKYEALKMSEAIDLELKEMFKGQYIDHGDKRLTEVLKGYVMQAVLYHLTGQPFCENRSCRLFNAHWQSEVLAAQIGNRDFCPKHEEMLKSLAGEMQ